MHNKFLWAAIVWTLFLTYFCLTGSSQIPQANWLNIPNKDKAVHFIFYFVFTLLWCLYFWSKKSSSPNRTIVLTFFMAVVYGSIIEVCQGVFTADRSADIMDALANTAGSALAVLVLWFLKKKKE